MTEAHNGATGESLDTPLLDDQRALLIEALEAQRGNVAAFALERASTGTTGDVEEDLDEGERSQLVDRANSDSLEHQLTDRIGEFEAALRRIEEGTYGICTRLRPSDRPGAARGDAGSHALCPV